MLTVTKLFPQDYLVAAILDFQVAIVTESVILQTSALYQNVQNYLLYNFVAS